MKPAAQRHSVRFENLNREAPCRDGETVFQAARRAGIRIVGACGGRGVCGTCMAHVLSGRTQSTAEGRRKKWERACQLRPVSDCVVEVAPRSLARVVRAEVEGRGELTYAPAVRARELSFSAPTLERSGADADRVLEALHGDGARRIDLEALRALPAALRDHDWRIRAAWRGDEVISVAAPGRRSLGLAVDLGTTNCAAYLLDLDAGEQLAGMGIENPQGAYGADLVSRMNFAIGGAEQQQELRSAAATALRELGRTLCESVSAGPQDIVDLAVCGNTAMHHLLLGLPVRQLGRAPYVPASCQALDVKARELGLECAPGAYLHCMPNVGGYVGGDHVAALLGTESRWRDATALVMDIGTNTEISLVHRGGIRTVSCPSGPALEGGHISCGMRAAEGAIERVWLEGDRIEVKAIGDTEAVGLCGSGVLDALAVLVEAGIVDWGGRLDASHPRVSGVDGRREAVIAPGVAFTQADVRAVQLAKAAIRTGVDMLLRESGLAEAALERVIIAGAFGTYIRVESAIAIGLLPSLPLERFEQVGNAAGLGVRMVLASGQAREQAKELAQRCRYLELGSLPGFQKAFLARIGFKMKNESQEHAPCA